MIHRFPNLWAEMFDRSDREGNEWATALAENGQPCEPQVEMLSGWG